MAIGNRTACLLGSAALYLVTALPGTVQAQQVNPLVAVPRPLSALAVHGRGNYSGAGQAVLPPSSVIGPDDGAQRVHTNIQVFVPTTAGALPAFNARPSSPAANVTGGPPYAGYYFNTPASLACVYGLSPATTNCDPETLTSANNATGGSNTVAVIVIGTVSSLTTDAAAYSTQFGLPAPSIQVATEYGSTSASGTGYDLAGLAAIETVHALAPKANIFVVQCKSNSVSDFEACISFAGNSTGAKQTVITASTAEFAGETSAEGYFANTVYFAAAGDGPGVQWPAASPSVVAVGGTSLSRRNDMRIPGQYGMFRMETVWSGTGGGVSAYFQIPSYQQNTISSRLQSGMRGVPDVAFDANPLTPVWVYCSSCSSTTNPPVQSSSWYAVGGTGLAAAGVAAIANDSGKTYTSGAAQLTKLYSQLGTSNFYDVNYGVCGTFAGYGGTAGSGPGDPAGWDFCSGLGAPRGTGAF